jgi:subtilisin family serine protease
VRRSLLWLSVAGLAVALFASGCSKGASKLTGPGPSTLVKAPLISHTGARAVPNGWIVVFKSTVANVDGDVDEIEGGRGFRASHRYHSALKGFAATLPAATVEALRSDARVAYIEQDQIAQASVTQTGATWGLDRVDQVSLPLNGTYTYNQTGAGVDAYIIDTGINFTHQEFGGRAVTGVDEITIGGTAADANGHGTHVSGTVGGATYGIAKAVHLIAVRVLDATGSGTYAQVIAGVDWVTADHTTHPAVANMSLGGPVSTALDASVRGAIADGVVFCVAAGNSAANVSTSSPADVAEAITVGATDNTDRWASFSNFGAGVDILGPGVNITSSWYTSNTATNTISGTSMATPHVTGSAALYLEANPGSTPAQVAAGLVAAASSGKITGVPSGTVNKLLYSIAGPAGPPPPPPAAPTLGSPADGATGIPTSTTLTWNASATATAYQVQVASDPGFTTIVSNQTNLAGTSAAVSGLVANTVYYWRVNASNAGGTSGWSASSSFTTAAGSPPAAPTLSSPANGATGVSRTPTLSWTAATGATGYHVQASTSSSFGTLAYDNAAVTGTSVTLPQLGSRATYYWRVSASNAFGISAYSGTWHFRTAR